MNKEKNIQIALFLLRFVAGLILLQAGGNKLFGWYGGLPGSVELNGILLTAGILEVGGGAAMMLGLFTRPVAFVLSGEMAVAYFLGHMPQGHFLVPMLNEGIPAVLLSFIFLFLAANGGGAMSLDAIVKKQKGASDSMAPKIS